VLFDEAAHHLYALRIVEHFDRNPSFSKQVLRSKKIAILTDDDTRNAKQQRRSGAHDAGTQRADENELLPIAAASGVSDADHFGVRGGIAILNSQVVAAGNDVSCAVGENRADRQAVFA